MWRSKAHNTCLFVNGKEKGGMGEGCILLSLTFRLLFGFKHHE